MVDRLLNFARFYATVKHAGQNYSGLPYTHHLQAVEAQVVKWFDRADWSAYALGSNALRGELQAAAWLHDVIEDCGVRKYDLEEQFGWLIADLVWRVSDEPGDNRTIRQALTYPKTREEPAAVFLKLCDRLANVTQGGSLVERYAKEFENFKRALHTPGQFEVMWEELEHRLEARHARN